MWMLSFVPDNLLEIIVNTLLLVGVVSTFLTLFVINRILRWIPTLAPFYPFLQALSVIILAAGIFFKGSYATEAAWRNKVREAEGRLQQPNKKLKKQT